MNLLQLYREIERLHTLLSRELCDCGAPHEEPMEFERHRDDCPYRVAVSETHE